GGLPGRSRGRPGLYPSGTGNLHGRGALLGQAPARGDSQGVQLVAATWRDLSNGAHVEEEDHPPGWIDCEVPRISGALSGTDWISRGSVGSRAMSKTVRLSLPALPEYIRVPWVLMWVQHGNSECGLGRARTNVSLAWSSQR